MELLIPTITEYVTKSATDVARGGYQSPPSMEDQIASALEVIEKARTGEGMSEQDYAIMADVLNAKSMVEKTQTDPNVLPQPYAQPSQFTSQYPQPLDPTEILQECEEISVYKALPEVVTDYNADLWREMTALDFDSTGEAADGFFLKGGCPDSEEHEGENKTITRKYLGVYNSISYEDLRHSIAVARAQGLGISRLATADGVETVIGVKEKLIKLKEILLLNKWDKALVKGSISGNSLAFDGMETLVTASGGACTNNDTTGAFDIEEFDNFLALMCARPTHLFGHPKALRAIAQGYLSLGATGGSQPIQQIILNQAANGAVIPGFTLAQQIHTFVGPLTLVPDYRFTTTQVGANAFSSAVFPLRMFHHGEPLVYKSTQTPMSYVDLPRGCTAFAFEVYAVTALVIKHLCSQGRYTSHFTGRVDVCCDIVGE